MQFTPWGKKPWVRDVFWLASAVLFVQQGKEMQNMRAVCVKIVETGAKIRYNKIDITSPAAKQKPFARGAKKER